MLNGISIAIIGGDNRQLEVIKKCVSMNANVKLIGFDIMENKFSGVKYEELEKKVFKDIDAIILPIIGTDEEGYVKSNFSNKILKIDREILSNLPKKCRIYTGKAKNYLFDLCFSLDIELVELLDRDDIAILNSIPTAEGTILLAIQNTDFTIHGSDVVVLGFGRTGITVARDFKVLGASVKVGVRKEKYMARIYEMGLEPFHIDNLSNIVNKADILINTIPAKIITKEVIKNMSSQALIIDLASKPGGTDFDFAKKVGIKALLALGLPGIVAPKTAGSIIANATTKLILEQTGKPEGK